MKKGQFCPECNKVFGRESLAMINSRKEPELVTCWVCARPHHASCVGQPNFICSSCQRKTKDKTIGAGKMSMMSGTSFRRVSAINTY